MPGYKADALPTHISMRHDPKQTPQPASAGDAPIIDMSGFDALNLHAPPRAPRANLQKASDVQAWRSFEAFVAIFFGFSRGLL